MTYFYILFGMREKMSFLELCVSPVLTQNQDIWNLWLTDFRKSSYAIVSNMTHFDNSHSVWNERKIPFFEVWVSPVLMQNPRIWHVFIAHTN